MKKFLVGAAATAAMLAPTMATAETNAVVGLQYTSTDIGAFDEETDGYGLTGAFLHNFDNGTYLQFEGAAERLDVGGCCYSTGYAAAHYGVRNDTHAFGGFVSFDELFLYSGLGLGIEGQWYLPNTVIGGSIAHTDFDDADISSTSASIDASYFFTPNLSLTGAVTFADDELYDDDLTVWGIGGEYRFTSNPISIELGYRQAEVLDDDTTAWTIGFNIDLGADTLHERATSGPSLNGAAATHGTFGLLPGIT